MDRDSTLRRRSTDGLGSRTVLVPVELVRPLRQSVLRPGQPPEESVYGGDEDPLAAHAAVLPAESGEPPASSAAALAVGSLLPEDPPPWLAAHVRAALGTDIGAGAGLGTARWWRIRGMATAEGRRSRGLGGAVLGELLARAADQGGGVVWCNARVPAVPFYLRAGFQPVGRVFEVPLIGAHQAMWRAVAVGWDTDDPVQVSEDPPHSQGAVHA